MGAIEQSSAQASATTIESRRGPRRKNLNSVARPRIIGSSRRAD